MQTSLGIRTFSFPFPPLNELATMVKLDKTCAFDTLFTKCVPHVLENIFFRLDHTSLEACMEVSQNWKKLLSSEAYQNKYQELLIEKKESETKLLNASKMGNVEEVTRLLSTLKVGVNFVEDHDRWTPLYEAAYNGHNEVVKLLLDAGMQFN